MLIERCAYASRWRRVSPAAKGLFALAGLVAAFAAAVPMAALVVALLLALVTVFGAGVPFARYLRVALPALLFLLAGTLPLAFSFGDTQGGDLAPQLASAAGPGVATVLARSLGALTALLFLVTTTPLVDLIGLLRRLKAPELLLDLMVLGYRMLTVFSAALRDARTAQTARLGYASPRFALRSLAALGASLAGQVWVRAAALQQAVEARNNEGPLRFLETEFEGAGRHTAWALAAGGVLLGIAAGLA